MIAANRSEPISDLLRRTITQAVESGRINYKALERETGVTRASIMRFVRGSQSLRLDMADRLAAYFGLFLRAGRPSPSRPGRRKADP
jgi:plasmid maintenance system antidote protein VapI